MIDAQRWARWVVYFTDWAGFLTSAPAGAALPGVRPDDIAQIQYTSGTTGGPAPSPDELRAYCREHLAPYKTPRHWVFVDAFPMTPSGKIQKYKLRESFTSSSGS